MINKNIQAVSKITTRQNGKAVTTNQNHPSTSISASDQGHKNPSLSFTPKSTSSISVALTELSSMKSALRTLQRDSVEQIELEVQTQATFEHFGSQLISLRKSFNTLADLVVNETESLWKVSDEKEKKMQEFLSSMKALEENIQTLKRTISTLTNICHENQLEIINELNNFDGDLQKVKQLESHFNTCLSEMQSSIARHECEMSIIKQDNAQKESSLLYLHREINKLQDTFKYYKRKKPISPRKILQQQRNENQTKGQYGVFVMKGNDVFFPNTQQILTSDNLNGSNQQDSKVVYFKEKEKDAFDSTGSSDNENSDRSCSDLPTSYLVERVALLEQQVQQLIISNNQLTQKVHELEKKK